MSLGNYCFKTTLTFIRKFNWQIYCKLMVKTCVTIWMFLLSFQVEPAESHWLYVKPHVYYSRGGGHRNRQVHHMAWSSLRLQNRGNQNKRIAQNGTGKARYLHAMTQCCKGYLGIQDKIESFNIYYLYWLCAAGDKFDVKEFHWEVLSMGFVPLTLLEESINNWIDNTLMSSTSCLCLPSVLIVIVSLVGQTFMQ